MEVTPSTLESLQPAQVLTRLGLLDWRAVAVGLELGFCTDTEVIEYTTHQAETLLGTGAPVLPAELERVVDLSGAQPGDACVRELVLYLAGRVDYCQEVRKWHLAAVTALDELDVPMTEKLQAMDDVYAEAGWPDALWNLGQYNGVKVEHSVEQRKRAKAKALRDLRTHLEGAL